jgi:hypothetical protein
MWMKLGDAAMGIVERLESGREPESPRPSQGGNAQGGLPDRGAAPAGCFGHGQVERAELVERPTGCRLGIAGPAAPIAAHGGGRNG